LRESGGIHGTDQLKQRHPLMEVTMVPFASLLAALGEIRDPRRPQGRRYEGFTRLMLA
jgi:hypothetical protein